MTEEKGLVLVNHFISCSRFNSTRCALCCVVFDRYKVCRRHCKELKGHLKEHPDLAETARQQFEESKNKNINSGNLFTIGDKGKFAGKNLPDEVLGCKICDFTAKSERGLRVHMRRSHKFRADF